MRLQRSRRTGARLGIKRGKILYATDGRPIVCCTRGGKYGNKFIVGEGDVDNVETAIRFYRASIGGLMRTMMRTELMNCHLACYCQLCDAHKSGKPLNVKCDACQPCHVDEIGKILYGS